MDSARPEMDIYRKTVCTWACLYITRCWFRSKQQGAVTRDQDVRFAMRFPSIYSTDRLPKNQYHNYAYSHLHTHVKVRETMRPRTTNLHPQSRAYKSTANHEFPTCISALVKARRGDSRASADWEAWVWGLDMGTKWNMM